MIKRICKYCCQELEFKNGWAFGSHIANCHHNPNYENKIKKLKKTHTLQRIKVFKKCEKCGKQFQIKRTISKLGKENISVHEKRFCSIQCSNSIGSTFVVGTKKSNCFKCGKEIVVHKLTDKRVLCLICKKIKKYESICQNCAQKYKTNYLSSKFCSKSCRSIYANQIRTRRYSTEQWSNKIKQTYINGKKIAGGTTKWYEYNGIKVQGTYELRTCKILDFWKTKRIIKNWEYTKDRFSYIGNDKKTTFISFRL